MKTKYKWIRFVEVSNPKRKTLSFQGMSTSEELLCAIEWYRNWRQYCFFPEDQTVFNKGCLADINHFIEQLMAARVGKRT